jgi:hypothetical protein
MSKIQLERLNLPLIEQTLSNNSEGTFNLDPKIDKKTTERMMNYLKLSHHTYNFVLKSTPTNYEIIFKRRSN